MTLFLGCHLASTLHTRHPLHLSSLLSPYKLSDGLSFQHSRWSSSRLKTSSSRNSALFIPSPTAGTCLRASRPARARWECRFKNSAAGLETACPGRRTKGREQLDSVSIASVRQPERRNDAWRCVQVEISGSSDRALVQQKGIEGVRERGRRKHEASCRTGCEVHASLL
ncbi:hypothetical protein BV25DRAFT_1580771 [Artomyces pyxidatus]|uniref:Uncharacterized protein n=1 Tax=Artomyces pyxidatus TaxID=48021 RepID=A0ACB8SKG0_9AGAM|nr:hypothetical protein BV25DRAFT_1580771 [Artomyces pyxidatus]